MKTIILTTIFLAAGICSYTEAFSQEVKAPSAPVQSSDTSKQVERIFESVEWRPEFPGGIDSLYKFIAQNIKYTPSARENGVEGRVIIAFVVNEDGTLSDVKSLLPASRKLGHGLEEEAIRVVKMMPNWKPGSQRGELVKMKYTLPIMFKLN
jgi:protein TonB